MEKDKISVVIPVYNAEKTIDRCMDSVVCNDYSNIEIICVNDGSKDRSLEKLKQWALKDSRVRILNIENSGPAHARNVGIDLAQGDYIAFVDADDYINKNAYTLLTEPLKHNDLQLIVGGYQLVSEDETNITVMEMRVPFNRLLNADDVKRYLIAPYYTSYSVGIPSLWNKLYKLSFIRECGIKIDEERIGAEDYWFNMEFFQTVDKAYIIKDVVYNYVQLTEGHVMSTYRDNQYEMFAKTRRKLLELNEKFQFKIDYDEFDSGFIQETNSFILQVISHEAAWRKRVFEIMTDAEYEDAISKCNRVSKQIMFIHFFVKIKAFAVVFFLYWLWYQKSRR